MTILITGINGFIGNNIAKALLSNHQKIIGISLEDKSIIQDKNLDYKRIDIKNSEQISKLFLENKITTVIHLAAIVHKKGNDLSYDAYYENNYFASKQLFEISTKYKVKNIMFASSIEVYGNSEEKIITENHKTNPISFYAKTKLLAEEELMKLAKIHQFNWAILRFAPVYGQNFKLNLNKRIYLKPQKIAYYFKNGDYFFNFCSINNITDFILAYLKKPVPGIYNISDSTNYQVKKIILAEKKYQDYRLIIIKMPYYLCFLLIFLYEKIANLFSKKEKSISIYNFRKLFKSTIYANEKAKKITSFDWDLLNTLYLV